MIIAVSGGADSANAFETAVLRAQENGLGILVYGLVAVLLWPNDSRADFETAVLQLAATQHRLYRTYYDLMNCRGEDADVQALRSTALQQEARFNAMLASAKTDSYEVWEVRYQWRHYQGLVSELQ